MPELPDVEVHRRYVDATSLHRTIADVFLREELVEDVAPQTIRDHLRGSRLTGTRRHGKHLFLHSSDGGWLRLHFGMTGRLEASADLPADDHVHLRMDFVDGARLAYLSDRKLGAISWTDDVDGFVAAAGLGPDAVAEDVDPEVFAERVGTRRGSVKSALMDQQVLAGLGNVYVDEMLFQSGIDPTSSAGGLTHDHLDRLHEVMHHVIEVAVDRQADVDRLPDDWLLPHREPGLGCPRCEGQLRRTEVGGRATYHCPAHQEHLT